MTEPRTNRIQAAADAQARAARDLARLTKGGRDAGVVAAASLAVLADIAAESALPNAEALLHLARDTAALIAEGAEPSARDLALIARAAADGADAVRLSLDLDPALPDLAALTALVNDLAERALIGAAGAWLAESAKAPDARLVAAAQGLYQLTDAWTARTGRHIRLFLHLDASERDAAVCAPALNALGKFIDIICQRAGDAPAAFRLTLATQALGSVIELSHDGPKLTAALPSLADDLLDALDHDVGPHLVMARSSEPALAVIEAEIGRLGGALLAGEDVIRIVLPRCDAPAVVDQTWEAQAA
jgi:hypothetical protein